MKPPKSRAIHWWQRGIADGKVCARRNRARYFPAYLLLATEALEPGTLIGEFECVYRTAFRYGYDAEKLAKEIENNYFARPKRRANLTQT